jgi:hypothetical protein
VVNLTSRLCFALGKGSRYQLYRRLCGPQSWSGRKILCLHVHSIMLHLVGARYYYLPHFVASFFHLFISTYSSKCIICFLFVQRIFLHGSSSFVHSHFLFINCDLRFLVPEQLNSMCLTRQSLISTEETVILDSYLVFQTDYFNVNKGGYIKSRTVAVTVMVPWLALSHQNDC